MASKKNYELDEIGIMAPEEKQVNELHSGEVGYLAASIKSVADARVGDTITLFNSPAKAVSYTHLRAHETPEHLVCRLLLEKKKSMS